MTYTYKNKHTGQIRQVGSGFNWGAFLFGILYYWYKGLWGLGFIYLIICALTMWTFIVPVVLWFWWGFKFNEEYKNYLIAEGFEVMKFGD